MKINYKTDKNNLEELDDNDVVICRNEKEAIEFQKFLKEKGFKLCTGREYYDEIILQENFKKYFKNKTLNGVGYRVKGGKHGSLEYYLSNDKYNFYNCSTLVYNTKFIIEKI